MIRFYFADRAVFFCVLIKLVETIPPREGFRTLASCLRLVLNCISLLTAVFGLKYYFSNQIASLAFFKFSDYPFWM
nr:MAG TPA: hypothetical protein [Caudoviricetes sp.]